jgi:protein-tyrosine kinase
MGLIEQAAARLEELKRAGFDGGENAGKPAPAPAPAAGPTAVPHAVRREPAQPVSVRPVSTTQRPRLELDLARLAASGFVTPDLPRSRTADEYRIIKRPLVANASSPVVPVKNGNLIMVTSAVPAEGKTFNAINLAMSIAMEMDRTVLLVDADVARPSVPRTLGLAPTAGLLDVLGKKATLSDTIHRTNVERLTFLSAGTQHARAAELLASEAMVGLLEELRTRYSDRLIIFDSPPLLVTTEARLLATHMGQIVFIVHAETTLQSHVTQALATIESCPVKLIVLNGATTSEQGAYGYGYGYGGHDA